MAQDLHLKAPAQKMDVVPVKERMRKRKGKERRPVAKKGAASIPLFLGEKG